MRPKQGGMLFNGVVGVAEGLGIRVRSFRPLKESPPSLQYPIIHIFHTILYIYIYVYVCCGNLTMGLESYINRRKKGEGVSKSVGKKERKKERGEFLEELYSGEE